MSRKILCTVLLLLVVVGVFAFTSAGQTQASAGLLPDNQPPLCYPIQFFAPGYWGMECLDENENITSVVLRTNSPHTLVWNNSYAQMIVELEDGTQIYWEVCDSFGACQSGGYP